MKPLKRLFYVLLVTITMLLLFVIITPLLFVGLPFCIVAPFFCYITKGSRDGIEDYMCEYVVLLTRFGKIIETPCDKLKQRWKKDL